MFAAFRRAKALSVVKTMLQQTLAPLTVFGQTVPSSIYEDPYILGYLTTVAGFGTQIATQGKLSVDDIGRVTIEAFHFIAGANGKIAVESAIRFSQQQNSDFREGQRQANRTFEVVYGEIDPSDDPEFTEAIRIGSEMMLPQKPKDPRTAAAAYLGHKYFYNYVRERHRSSQPTS